MSSDIDSIIERIKGAFIRTGIFVESEAKKNLTLNGSVVTGRLRASISTAWTGSRTTVEPPSENSDAIEMPGGKFVVAVGTNVHYAPHVEFGTSKQRPKPFLRPAQQSGLLFLKEELKKA